MRGVVALQLMLALLLGCERPGVQAVPGELVVTPETLEFEPTFVGFPREREVVIHNRGRASRTLTITAAAPFLTAVEVVVPGGSETSLQVSFAPAEVGAAVGALIISDASERLTVALSGEGVLPLVCESAVSCEVNVFDPVLGRCASSQAADGTSCSNACLTGTCASGRCVGDVKDCSDSNPCTLDACDPNTGCHHPATECAAPTNPCKAARCDPALGCVESDVRDGVACGEADCVTALICLQGECKPATVPDGAACGSATPCQGRGTCQQSVCQQPAATPIPEAWSYDFPGQLASFQGVHDAAQNLYWVECAFAGFEEPLCDACTACRATSFTSSGTRRFGTVLPMIDGRSPLHHLIVGDQLIYASDNTIGAITIADGAPRWSIVGFPMNLAGAPDLADAQFINGLAAGPAGVTLSLGRKRGMADRQSVVVQLDPANAAIVFARFYDGSLSAPVIDETNSTSFTVTPWYIVPPQPRYLVSLSQTGVERWRVISPVSMPWSFVEPVAVFQGQLVLADGEVRSMSDGAQLATAPTGTLLTNPLMSPQSRVLLMTPQSATQVNAIAFGPGAVQPSWETLVTMLHGTNSITDTVATVNGGFLVATGDSRHPTALKAFNGAGVERFACELPWSAYGPMPVTLLDQRWVVMEPRYMLTPRLHVYEVPGEMPATRGWTGARGSPSGSNRPLP